MSADPSLTRQRSDEGASAESGPDRTPPVAARQVRFRPRWFALVWLSMTAALAVAGGLIWLLAAVSRPYPNPLQPETLVEIPRGASVAQIARQLENRGVISSARLFRLYADAFSISTRLQAGEYLFDRPLSLAQVARKLHRGEVHHHKLVVREGLDLDAILSLLEGLDWGSPQRFRELLQDGRLIAELDPGAENLEGYLFPDTYFLTRSMDEAAIVGLMVGRLRAAWTPERQRRSQELGMSLREVLTLASLIEKETARSDERPLVSSVFHNRLARNIPLACDPTVIYAVKLVKPFDGIIHRSDLQLDSPYNTYLHPGLPPGPISNSGLKSIDAALYPADTDYLYFVSRNDGSHVFSSTYREHARAVREFQR